MFFCYILQSEKDNRYYVGSCKNIDKRLKLHNKGSVISTRAFRPWRVEYLEQFDSRSLAQSRERKIKSWKKRSKIESLITSNISENPR